MTAIGYSLFVLLLLIYLIWSHLSMYKRGYAKGHKDGFQKGLKQGERTDRASIDDWWLMTEQQVNVEREKIWREES